MLTHVFIINIVFKKSIFWGCFNHGVEILESHRPDKGAHFAPRQ